MGLAALHKQYGSCSNNSLLMGAPVFFLIIHWGTLRLSGFTCHHALLHNFLQLSTTLVLFPQGAHFPCHAGGITPRE